MTNNIAEFIAHAQQTPTPPNSPSPPTPTLPPEAHPAFVALRDSTDGVLRAVVELHAPTGGRQIGDRVWGWKCGGCEFDGWEAESPDWPCATITTITGMLAVEHA